MGPPNHAIWDESRKAMSFLPNACTAGSPHQKLVLAPRFQASCPAGSDTQLGEPDDAHDCDHGSTGDCRDEQRRPQRQGSGEAQVVQLDDVLVLQDQDVVKLHYLGFTGSLPLGTALFIAAVAGAAVVAIVGVVRLTQLRVTSRRARRLEAGRENKLLMRGSGRACIWQKAHRFS